MLSLLWWLPLTVAAAALVPVWRGARRLEADAAGLRASVAELARLRPLVAEVSAELAAVAGSRSAGSQRPPSTTQRVARAVHDLTPR